MKVLVIGAGGREHALSWKISQSPIVTNVFVAPGNGGTELERLITNIDIQSNDIEGLADFASKEGIDLTIIGPEDPLVNGITDRFNELGLKCFGPTKGGAQLEGSKEFMKEFLIRHNIPTAHYGVFTDSTKAIEYAIEKGFPIVIKADGLAAGKGVTIAYSIEEAKMAINLSLESGVFGKAGRKIIIEEFLTGEEASFIVMTDGINAIPFPSSQDHKARDEMDKGPNTGGMGAYSPAPVVDEMVHKKIMNEIIHPTLLGLKKENLEYIGFLYAGMMIDKNKNLKVLEFNCRFGDPETQPIMMRIKSDLADLCFKACENDLENQIIEWDERKSLGVVIAAEGYPFEYEKNKEIKNIPFEEEDLKVFHAGTELSDEGLKSNGGRVLCVTALGSSVQSAQKKAYNAASKITYKDSFYRKDIGYRAIEREIK
jgi:phosphoribosylamine--glycine ligase